MVSQLASYHLNQPSLSFTSDAYSLSKCHSALTPFILKLLFRFSHGIAEQRVAADLRDDRLAVFKCVQGMFTVFADHFCAAKGKGLGYSGIRLST
jgi:hypothetical protein